MKFFSRFFSAPTGFGSAGIRRQKICGAVTVLGFTGQYGVETAETGISVKGFTVRYFPEINVGIMDNVGETRGKVKSQKFSREVTIEGEVLSLTGVMAFGLLTACVPANDVADFGDGSGTLLLDEVSISQTRADWRTASIKLTSFPGLII